MEFSYLDELCRILRRSKFYEIQGETGKWHDNVCRDKGSLCRNMVLRLQAIAWLRHCIFMSRQYLFLCRDNVATKVFVSRSLCCNMFGLGRDFSIVT